MTDLPVSGEGKANAIQTKKSVPREFEIHGYFFDRCEPVESLVVLCPMSSCAICGRRLTNRLSARNGPAEGSERRQKSDVTML
jgi:hypothetical protein